MPMSADADDTVVSILVWVNSPVTNAGRMSSVVPLPLPVEMFAVNELSTVPPLSTPPAPIRHDAPVPVALKLPLDCARAACGRVRARIASPAIVRIRIEPPVRREFTRVEGAMSQARASHKIPSQIVAVNERVVGRVDGVPLLRRRW